MLLLYVDEVIRIREGFVDSVSKCVTVVGHVEYHDIWLSWDLWYGAAVLQTCIDAARK